VKDLLHVALTHSFKVPSFYESNHENENRVYNRTRCALGVKPFTAIISKAMGFNYFIPHPTMSLKFHLFFKKRLPLLVLAIVPLTFFHCEM